MKPRILLSMPIDTLPNYAEALALAGAEAVDAGTGCDGLLLPGGGDLDPSLYGQAPEGSGPSEPERDRREMDLCRRFLAQGKPVLGICRGAQVMAAALGGTLLQDVKGHDQACGADRLHETRTAGLLLRLYGPEAVVNSAHHQAVDCLPPDCRLLQVSLDGVIEAFCHNTLPALAVQWHPERLCGRFARPDAVDGLPLLRAFLCLCGGRA